MVENLGKNNVVMPDGSIYRIKTDRYQKTRGPAQMLAIDCQNCDTPLLVYQKDGPGQLKRCYLDRIAWMPLEINSGKDIGEQVNALHKKSLKCPHCQVMVGAPMIYEKEKRFAVRMFPGQFIKKKYPNSKD